MTILCDGTEVVIRPIDPADKARLAAHHARLSPETARRRFLGPKPTLSGSELAYFTELDGRDHVALVAQRAAAPHDLLGVARFVRYAGTPELAEFAIVVVDDHHGQGLGTELGLRLADAARERGVRRFVAALLPDNLASRRLMHRLSDRLGDGRRESAPDEIVFDIAA